LEIAGYYTSLEKGFKILGADCDFVTREDSPYNYKSKTILPKILRARRIIQLQAKKTFNKPLLFLPLRVSYRLLSFILWYTWAIKAIFKYDLFIFGFGKSLFFANFDVIVLRILGKKVIMNLCHGAEVRPPYLDGVFQSLDPRKRRSALELKIRVLRNKKRAIFLQKYCTHTIGQPYGLSSFATSKFINSLYIGLPCDTDKEILLSNNLTSLKSNNIIRILHAPSDSKVKGSEEISIAIDNLRSLGYPIKFIKIEGMTNDRVLNEIANCDFIVDQIYSDHPMAGLATEGAIFGKPSIVGGYGLKRLEEYCKPEFFPPSLICLPDQIQESIELLITNRKLRLELGEKAKDFVNNNWRCDLVAERYLNLFHGFFPDYWWLDPKNIFYSEGCGQSKSVSTQQIYYLVKLFGDSALGLDDNPELKKYFINQYDLVSKKR
jgi:hypothetical protein